MDPAHSNRSNPRSNSKKSQNVTHKNRKVDRKPNFFRRICLRFASCRLYYKRQTLGPFAGYPYREQRTTQQDTPDLPSPVYPRRGPTDTCRLRGEHAVDSLLLYLLQQSGDRVAYTGERANRPSWYL